MIDQQYKLPDDLFSYQKEDVEKILNSDSNILNLSEMGVGKTPVAIAATLLGDHKKTLICCPKRLTREWERQIKMWTGIEPSVARRGCYRRLETLFDDFLHGKDNPFFVVNYETFRTRRHLDILNMYPFDYVIMDEVHRLRNPKTKQTKGMFEFLRAHDGIPLLMLTGSPIVNNPADLHTLLCMARPHEFSLGGRNLFIDRWCYWKPTRYGVKVTGVKDMERLKEYTSPYTIRHTKKECLPYLPDKYYRTVMLEMDRAQREAYDSMEQEFFIELDNEGGELHAPSVLARLMRLRQINLEPRILGLKELTSSKTEFLKDLIDDMLVDSDGVGNGNSQKLVVFSCFESYIQYLHYVLPIDHVMITGTVKPDAQADAVDRFQNDPKLKLVLGTIQCMGEGITLTAASNVVLMDRWWNPAVNSQAIDRCHRIGQKNAVQVIQPINEFSIDQSLDAILAGKAALSGAYLGEEDTVSAVVDDLRKRRSNAGKPEYPEQDDSGEEDTESEE